MKSSTVKEVEKVLIRNWSLLVSLKEFVKDEMTEESRMIWLRRKGFDFNFHTHVQPLSRCAVLRQRPSRRTYRAHTTQL